MAIHPRAGQKAQQQDLHNIPALVSNYFLLQPDPANPAHKVEFGTSGHRGTADKSPLMKTTFSLSRKLSLKYVLKKAQLDLYLLVKIRMLYLNLRSQVWWKSWLQMV